MKLDILEGLACAVHRELAFGGAIGIVKSGSWGAAFGDLAQIINGEGFFEAVPGEVQAGLLERHKFFEFAGLGELTLYHGAPSFCGVAASLLYEVQSVIYRDITQKYGVCSFTVMVGPHNARNLKLTHTNK